MKAKHILTTFLATVALSASAGMSNSMELTQLYIVGDATATAWDLGNADELHRIDKGVFLWTGTLTADKDFKFMNSRDGWHKHIVATQANTEVSITGEYPLNFYANWALDGSLDCKFHVAETGTYTIFVDLNSMRMTITNPLTEATWPDEFYLTGSSVDNKVIEIPNQYEIEHKASIYLKPGEVKLIDTPTISETTHYYRPIFEDIDVTFGNDYYTPLFEYDGSAGCAWNVTVEGYYNVYLDNKSHTYLFRKSTPAKVLYLVGGCCEKAWNYWAESNCKFQQSADDPDVMVWEGELRIGWEKKDDGSDPDEPNKFKILTAQDWVRDTYHPYIADATAEGSSGARISGGDDLKWTISADGYYRLELNTRTEILTGTLITPSSESLPQNSPIVAGVDDISNDNSSDEICYYDLQGNRILEPTQGFYIEVTGRNANKVLVR